MAQRRIGQKVFRFSAKAERQTTLDELGALIDWSLADSVLAALYKARKGEKTWPPWALLQSCRIDQSLGANSRRAAVPQWLNRCRKASKA